MSSPHADEHGVGVLARFLDETAIEYEVLEHQPVYAADDEAQSVGEPLQFAAKTLALHDRGGWRVAVLPSNQRLDLDRARRLLGATSHLRLATEDEMASAFPQFDVGALPPVGPMLPLPEVVDVRLLYKDHVVFSGGDHRHAIRLDPRDLVRLAEPRVGDICQHEPVPHRKGFTDLPTA